MLTISSYHNIGKGLHLWFEAMWHITNQKYGANALGLQKILGLGSYHTAWKWLHKFRRAMVRPGRDTLTGIVEISETSVANALGKGSVEQIINTSSLLTLKTKAKHLHRERGLVGFVSNNYQRHPQKASFLFYRSI